MLKIKDNVDLKELEKFGFVYGCEGYSYPTNEIVIYIDDLNIVCFQPKNNDWLNFPDVIYDLIQAGLVEKVEEK